MRHQSSHSRKSWDCYFMDIAYMAATRATCPRRQVGAVLVQDRKLMGSAYNGAPAGVTDCYEGGCLLVDVYEKNPAGEIVQKQHCIRTIHAEQNLILFTDRAQRLGSTVYVTDSPCWTCANMLANSGIAEIVYHRPYEKDLEKVSRLLQEKGIGFRLLETYQPPRVHFERIGD
ncbi:deoxycytidylate deaminase [Kyrpidia spormannii]|uniref:CMP deaminase n=1 Tax=Kyrpidia spormannii TaxID=2055160 RepID=A0ACA8Z4D8_9BACL|nr:dCMP deaminase family protein [Kyrpidia spormannii]CAB3389270.1 CMP deaminase [Kyrpidia spormannii]